MADETEGQEVGRRRFLKSIFGLGSIVELPAVAKPTQGAAKFFWADLRTGQIGFPCGQVIPSGPPGSIAKVVGTAALIETGLCRPEEQFECRGTYKVHNEEIHCQYPHGILDLTHALGLSCNIYFAQASKKLSANVFLQYASKFGFDQPVGGFASGKFPISPVTDSLFYLLGLDTGFQPSALQILRMSALVAKHGVIPYLHSAEAPDPKATPFNTKLSDLSWRVLEQGMQIAAREGTAKKLDPEHVLKVSVKTGTTPHGNSFQSWITGYFPWDTPRYAFVLRAPAGTSQDAAVPAAKSFLFANQWP